MAVGFGRDVGRSASGLDLPPDSVAVIALVGVQQAALGQALQEQSPGRTIGDLPTCQQEGKRAAEAVSQCVDFGRAPAA